MPYCTGLVFTREPNRAITGGHPLPDIPAIRSVHAIDVVAAESLAAACGAVCTEVQAGMPWAHGAPRAAQLACARCVRLVSPTAPEAQLA